MRRVGTGTAGVVLMAMSIPVLAACSSSGGSGGSGGPAGGGGGAFSTAAHTTFTMPQTVGKTLPVAKADIDRAARNLMFVIQTEDALGRNRPQDRPQDWKVCTQSVPAGQEVDQTAYVKLAVVRRVEACPK